MYSTKYFLAYTEPITTFWANTEPLQNHCQKTKYTEQCSVYRTGWQHCKCVKLLFPKVLKTFFLNNQKKIARLRNVFERLRYVSHYCHKCNIKKKLSPYFWKEQFDTFDNQCDVLRAAFCDSHNVSMGSAKILPNSTLKNPQRKL